MENNKNILEKLENHEKRICKNEEDINNIKIDSTKQEVIIQNLNTSMEKLNTTIEKLSEKLESYMLSSGKKGIEDYKWIIAVVLIPAIFYLLNLLKIFIK